MRNLLLTKRAHPGIEKCFCMHPEKSFKGHTAAGSVVVTAAKTVRLVLGF